MKHLKLYVWEQVLIDWTDGAMGALATSPDEARAEILKSCSYVPATDLAKEPTEHSSPVGFVVWGGG